MVAINSIPQHEVAKGNGQIELALPKPTALSIVVAKKPAPSIPGGAVTMSIAPLPPEGEELPATPIGELLFVSFLCAVCIFNFSISIIFPL
jgi:hypothetical protein